MKHLKKHKFKYLIISIVLVIVSICAYLVVWIGNPYSASENAINILNQNPNISRVNEDYLIAQPDESSKRGIIIYPGGLVEPEAYVTLSKGLADEGYFVAIIDMPWNLAVLDPLKGQEIIEEYDQIEEWIIMGHSLGGSMAVRLAVESDKVVGLVLLASYPEGSLNISSEDFKVLSISASNDMIINESNLIESEKNLPVDTVYKVIEGGNHSQFGDYGLQENDGVATISPEQQLDLVIQYLKEWDTPQNSEL
ncbi:alpha/beta hydrolase [Candidatus Dojkabacteria bacterium]|uniref:Alpha/beta hydrolase n=1 Tax=Candidatus Dojkabacteria bacterium TaxID=2099670 RepID=A0A955RJD8_9BACT|nr:alpha/beta hydrolase [Candidatus Dojkabacteria bacterium]